MTEQYPSQAWEQPPKRSKPSRKKFWLTIAGVAVGVLVLAGVLGAIFGNNEEKKASHRTRVATEAATTIAPTTAAPQAPPPPPPPPRNPPTISLDEFNQITTGMSYDQVVEIIGGPGSQLAHTEIAGYVGDVYMWDGEGGLGANANVQFQNGKVIGKAQFGLR